MFKKIIVLLLTVVMIFSMSACGTIDTAKDMLKDYLEQFEPVEDTTIDEDKEDFENIEIDEEDDETNEEDKNVSDDETIEPVISGEALTHLDMERYEEPKDKSVFSDYEDFYVYISRDDITEYCITPITYTVFDDKNDGIETKTKLPAMLDAGEIVSLEAKIFGKDFKTKLINFYNDKKQAGDEATLCYYESKIYEGCEYKFPLNLTQDSTKSEFLNTFGENDYGNASLTEDILCYDVPCGDLNQYNAFLELTFNIETQKLVSFRYGLFVPEYLQEK